MSEELKPCPFCGDIPKKYSYPNWGDGIECFNPNCIMNEYESMKLEVWNTRPNEGALTAERDALKAQLGGANRALSTAMGELTDARADIERITAELETMRGLCKTLEVNLSGQNDTVEEMHGEVMRLTAERDAARDAIQTTLAIIDISDAATSSMYIERWNNAINKLRAALEPKS